MVINALLALDIGLSLPVAITTVAVCGMEIFGGWFYVRWSRVVTDVCRDQPDTARLRKVGHRIA